MLCVGRRWGGDALDLFFFVDLLFDDEGTSLPYIVFWVFDGIAHLKAAFVGSTCPIDTVLTCLLAVHTVWIVTAATCAAHVFVAASPGSLVATL